jgi:hypothetical protein
VAFFERIIAECKCAPGEIAHVGDRLDHDIRPALAAGMVAVFMQRGPWGYIHAADPDVAQSAPPHRITRRAARAAGPSPIGPPEEVTRHRGPSWLRAELLALVGHAHRGVPAGPRA